MSLVYLPAEPAPSECRSRRALRPRSNRANSTDLNDASDRGESIDSSEDAEFSEPDPEDDGEGEEEEEDPPRKRRKTREPSKERREERGLKRPRDDVAADESDAHGKKHKTGPIPSTALDEAKRHVLEIEEIALREKKSPEAFYEKLGLIGSQTRAKNNYNNFEMWFAVNDEVYDKNKSKYTL